MEMLVSNRGSSNEPGRNAFADSDGLAAYDPATDGVDSGSLWAEPSDISGSAGRFRARAGGRCFTNAGIDSRVLACWPMPPMWGKT